MSKTLIIRRMLIEMLTVLKNKPAAGILFKIIVEP